MRTGRHHISLLLFSFLLSVYTLTNAGTFHIIDEVSLFAVTESVAQRREADTNTIAWSQWVNSPGEVLGAFGPDGEVYSKKGPAPAFLSAGWYTLALLLARLGLPWGLLQATLLWNGVITAATAVLLWKTAVHLGYGDRTGVLLGLIFGLGTIAWPYANHLFGEPLSALGLLLCFYGLIGWQVTVPTHGENAQSPIPNSAFTAGHSPYLWLAGIGAAIAVTTVTAHALLVAAFGSYLLYLAIRRFRFSIRTLAALLPFAFCLTVSLFFLAWYNSARFGHPLDTGYHFDSGEGFSTPLWQGFWGLIASPYRGVFWHTPIFFLSMLAFPAFLRRHRQEGALIAALSLILVGMYSAWWMWWGGFAWGPRFLVPLTPFWVLLLAPILQRMMAQELRVGGRTVALQFILYSLLFTLSFVVQLSAVVVNYVNYEIRLRDVFPTDWRDPLAYGPPAQSIADLRYSPVVGQWRLMAENFIANTDLAWLWPDGTVQWIVPIAGGLVLLVLGWGLANLGLKRPATGEHSAIARRLWSVVALGLPVVFIAVWLTNTGRHPLYGEVGRGYRAILAEIEETAGDGDALLTITPFHYQIPMNWLRRGLPIYGYAADSMAHAETAAVLGEALATHAQIWYVTAGVSPSDPNNTVEHWLASHAFKADDRWFDDFRLVRYGTPNALHGTALQPFDTTLGDAANRVQIRGARVPAMASVGTTLPVEIHYQANVVADPLRWFVQLLGPDGAAAALLDTAPYDGYTAFPDLPVNEDQVERAGLALPPDLPGGTYRIIAGLYNPAQAGAPRLQTSANGDYLELGTVRLQ